jgi:integrase
MADKRITVWVQRFNDRPALVLQWTDPETGKRKSKSAETADEGEAERKRADLEYELNNGLHKQASGMSWEKFRELFEAEYVAGCRKNTRLNYQATLDAFERLCKPRSLRAVTGRTVSTFAAALRNEPGKRKGETMMPSTIKVRLQFLHTALSWAVEQKMLPEVPKFPEVKVPKKRPRPVPAESFEKLLAKAEGDPEMQAYLLCGWLAGLRLNEALALEREPSESVPYVDWAGDRITFPAEFVKATEDQWVPLAPDLRRALEALPRQGRKVFHFTSTRDGSPVTDSAISDRVGALAKLAGVRLSYHTLRKGFGCRYASRVPAQVLQKLMRHSSIRTTMDYYANVDDAAMQAVLGDQRNSSRNSQPPAPSAPESSADATLDGGTPSAFS